MLQTEFLFTLPCGYIDEQGNLHREGVMRRATALDEVEPLGDGRVLANEAYISILLLGRVIIRLGTLASPGFTTVERLFATDFVHLQALYARINSAAPELIETACPGCGTRFAIDVAGQ